MYPIKRNIEKTFAQAGIKVVSITKRELGGVHEWLVDLPDDVEEKRLGKPWSAILSELETVGLFVRAEPFFGDADKKFYLWTRKEA